MTPKEARKGPPKDDGRNGSRTANSWLRYSHLGTQFTVTLLVGVFAGIWADGRFGTDPWLTIAGSLLGIFAAMYVIIRETSR